MDQHHLTALEERLLGGLTPRRGSSPMVRGEGCWLWDAEDRRYLDLTSAYGVACLGHSHPALCAAISTQAQRLIACYSSFYNDQRGRLASKLMEVSPPHLSPAFLCNSGAEAIEAGLKFARLATRRTGIVALKQGFHGRTLGALSATWNPRIREPFLPLLDGVSFATPNDSQSLEEAVDERTAVVIVEVIQGEGGIRLCDVEFLRHAQDLCRERGALFMIDEIQTGFGRTGVWFAHQPPGLEPDVLALAKGMASGLPVGAVCVSDVVARALVPGAHGSTFGGNPLACAAACATIETLQREDLPRKAAAKGDLLLEGLRKGLGGRRCVREIRGRGLMIGVELRERVAPLLKRLMEDHGVLALAAGPTVLRLLPALVITEEQIEDAIEALMHVIPD